MKVSEFPFVKHSKVRGAILDDSEKRRRKIGDNLLKISVIVHLWITLGWLIVKSLPKGMEIHVQTAAR